jgi:hypothetical protein
MERENLNGRMDVFMMENGKMTSEMDLVECYFLTELNMRDIG